MINNVRKVKFAVQIIFIKSHVICDNKNKIRDATFHNNASR